MGINVLRIELVRETGNLRTYKITYQEETEIETTLVGNTFNYSEEPKVPEAVLDFAEKWILGNLQKGDRLIMIEERTCINIFSTMNPWMDVIILVSDRNLEKTKEIAGKAYDEFWTDQDIKDSDMTYGDLIGLRLEEANIDYELYFKEDEEE